MRLNLNLLSKNLFDFIFPTNCLGCGKPGGFACAECLKKIKPPRQTRIPGLPLLYCTANYHDQFPRAIIHAFKYELITDLSLPCAQVIAEFLKKQKITFNRDWLITYVPIHPHRETLRGFNQAKLVAQWLSEMLGLEMLDALEKTKQTRSQMKLGYNERVKNLKGVFKVKANIRDMKIILIDDVCTTGSTLIECSKVLRQAGAAEIVCLVFARD